jgi:hypothetical protein
LSLFLTPNALDEGWLGYARVVFIAVYRNIIASSCPQSISQSSAAWSIGYSEVGK